MAYSYCRKPDDVSYRKVNITVAGTGKFEDFQEPNQVIHYPETGCVLEVLRRDGTTELYYDGPTLTVTYLPLGQDTLSMGKVPVERLWIRKGGSGISYKLPNVTPDSSGLLKFRIPGGVAGIEVFGDKYFEKIFTLVSPVAG